jgi:hypothetical protein
MDIKSMRLFSRRNLIRGGAGIAMGLSTGLAAALPQRRNRIEAIRICSPIFVPDNFGDTFAPVWADDGHLYTPSNDTLCFGLPEFFTKEQVRLFQSDFAAFAKQLTSDQKKQWQYGPIGFNRIEGNDPSNLRGFTVNRMQDYMAQNGYRAMLDGPLPDTGKEEWTWKSSGCAFVDGAFYWFISRQQFIPSEKGSDLGRWNRSDGSFIKSADYGAIWTRSAEENRDAPMFPGSTFSTPYFIDYGRGPVTVDGADQYVYAISNNGFWDNGDTLILARVRRSRIRLLNASDWEFYVGGDGLARGAWSQNASAATPILHQAGQLSATGATYLPDRKRYMMVDWYYPVPKNVAPATATTVWQFYEAPKPWGPWTQVGSHTWAPQGYYSPVICPKFQTVDRIYVVTAGDWLNWWDYYRLTFVPVDIH